MSLHGDTLSAWCKEHTTLTIRHFLKPSSINFFIMLLFTVKYIFGLVGTCKTTPISLRIGSNLSNQIKFKPSVYITIPWWWMKEPPSMTILIQCMTMHNKDEKCLSSCCCSESELLWTNQTSNHACKRRSIKADASLAGTSNIKLRHCNSTYLTLKNIFMALRSKWGVLPYALVFGILTIDRIINSVHFSALNRSRLPLVFEKSSREGESVTFCKCNGDLP